MASPRLSSSRNCANSGANFRVSACALRRPHHLPIATESDQTDMTAKTNQMILAKMGIVSQSSASECWPTADSLFGGCGLVGLTGTYLPRLNTNGCWTSCFTFRPPTSAAWKRIRESEFLTADVKRSWLDSITLKVLTSTRPVVSTTNCAMTCPATPWFWSMLGYVGDALLRATT